MSPTTSIDEKVDVGDQNGRDRHRHQHISSQSPVTNNALTGVIWAVTNINEAFANE